VGVLGLYEKYSTLIGQSWAKPVTSTVRQRASQTVRDKEGNREPSLPSLMRPETKKINKNMKRNDDNNDIPTWGVPVHWTRLELLDISQKEADRFQLEREREKREEEEREESTSWKRIK